MGDQPSARCASCGTELYRVRGGEWTLANKILRMVGTSVVARCPTQGCGADVPVPFLTLRAAEPEPVERPTRVGVRRVVHLTAAGARDRT